MSVTIKDVAKETGLAISTISKYMNGGNVRPDNREKIEKAVQKLGYSPNNFARGLRSARTYTVGVLIQSMEGAYCAKLVGYLEKYLQEIGCGLILCCHGNSFERAEEYVEFLCGQLVDGIIAISFPCEKDYLERARNADIPIVSLEEANAGSVEDLIQTDAAVSSYELIRYLISMGHRKIGVIKGPENSKAAQEQIRGFRRVMEDYEIPVREEWIVRGNYDTEGGYRAMMQIWEQTEKPTAVFVTNYYSCIGVIRAVEELNICIPEELSLVSFDDHILSVLNRPKLTTVEQPLEEIARETCILLNCRIEKQGKEEAKRIRIPGRIIYRDSVVEK